MSHTIQSQVIGKLIQEEDFEEWWRSQPVSIPFFDGKALDIVFADLDIATDIPDADAALRNFLNLTISDRKNITPLVYKNCMDFLEAVGYEEEDKHLWNIKDKEKIWQYVYPTEIFVERRTYEDKDVYIVVACECEWEQEHGLQLVFRQGKKLTRVSDQDGHLTEADAYDKPDSEDNLLSSFSITEGKGKKGFLEKIKLAIIDSIRKKR